MVAEMTGGGGVGGVFGRMAGMIAEESPCVPYIGMDMTTRYAPSGIICSSTTIAPLMSALTFVLTRSLLMTKFSTVVSAST